MTLKEKLLEHRQAVLEIADQHGAHNLRIFGSVAKGTDGVDSDVDLLVDIDKGISLFDYVGLIQALEELLGCKVDLAEPDTLHPIIREQVLQEAVPL